VALLWALAGPPGAPPGWACPRPHEALGVGPWTAWVVCDPKTPSRPLRGASPLLFGGRIDLNGAPPAVLEVLPRIGPARAEGLARERARRPFASLADVVRVHGIGPVTARGLAAWAEVRPTGPEGAASESQKGRSIASKSK